MYKKLMALLLVGALLMSLLVGCGPKEEAASNDGDAQETTGGTTEEGAEQEVEEIELTFMHNLLEETEGGAAIAFRDAIDKVLSENPGLTITEEALASSSYHTKIKTTAAGNELPDIFVIRASMLDMLIETELVGSIDEDLNADTDWKDGFLDGSFQAFSRGDKVYGIPLSAKSTSVVFYNEDIFNEVGIEQFPQNFEEFKQAVATLAENGYTPISLGNKDKWVAQSCIISTLGDRFTGTEWFDSILSEGGASFTDQEFVNALNAMKELADLNGFNEDSSSIDNMQQRTPYYNKEAAMFIEGAWAIGDVSKDAPEDVLKATKLALLPPVEGSKGRADAFSGGSSVAFVINSELSGEKRALAVEVLKALSSPEYGKTMTEYNKFAAVKPAAYDESKLTELTKQYMELAGKTTFTPVYDAYLPPAVIEVINSGLQELVIDLVTPEELADKIQKEYERTLE
ncbi:extracellular solute-binding protein [Vallitaleaceae bacterium 9-2]